MSPKSAPTEEEIIDTFRRNEIFGVLDSATREALANVCKAQLYRRGEVILVQDQPGESAYLVIRGNVRIYRRSDKGKILELTRKGPAMTFGEVAILDGSLRTACAAATTTTWLVEIPKDVFVEILKRAPETIEPTLKVLGRMIRETSNISVDLVFRDAKERIASRILLLIEQLGTQMDLTHTRRFTQTELAEMIGGTRQTVNAALKTLSEKGAISVDVDGIRVLDVESLKREAG